MTKQIPKGPNTQNIYPSGSRPRAPPSGSKARGSPKHSLFVRTEPVETGHEAAKLNELESFAISYCIVRLQKIGICGGPFVLLLLALGLEDSPVKAWELYNAGLELISTKHLTGEYIPESWKMGLSRFMLVVLLLWGWRTVTFRLSVYNYNPNTNKVYGPCTPLRAI